MYDYLTERFQLAQILESSVRVMDDPQYWGAKRIESSIVDDALLVRITDAEQTYAPSGEVIRLLSGWPPTQRRGYADLHWCVDIWDLSNDTRVARQQAVDTELRSLLGATKLALTYALAELEPK